MEQFIDGVGQHLKFGILHGRLLDRPVHPAEWAKVKQTGNRRHYMPFSGQMKYGNALVGFLSLNFAERPANDA